MKKIGFLGGTFNPIHNGHIEIARIAAKAAGLEEVILMPAGLPPHKEGNYEENANHRLNMVRLAAEGEEGISVSDYEMKKEGKSYSYLTMEHFKEVYKNCELYFILGDEAFCQLHTWKNPERLKAAVKFIVINRDGLSLPEDVIKVKIPPIEISSTMIRNLVKNGENAEKYLNPKVLEYIKENGLYR